MNPPGHALFISRVRLHKLATGTTRRFELLVDAVAHNAKRVEFLFYLAEESAERRRELAAEFVNLISRRWPIEPRVHICAIDPAPLRSTLWTRYVLPSRSIFTLPQYCRYSGPAQVQALQECLAHQPRFIMVQRLQCMMPILRAGTALGPLYFDLDDIEHTAFRRSIAEPPVWKSKYLQHLYLPALLQGEYHSIRRAAKVFVCSSLDKRKLATLFRAQNIVVVPNAVTLPATLPQTDSLHLLLVATFSYPPNRIGVEYFLDRIWPQIRARLPQARIVVAGSTPEVVRHYQNPPPGVSFAGFVDDLTPLYREARFTICPILSGGGTRVKIIESAAHGRVTVSTPLGAEGLDFVDGVDIILGRNANLFADHCVDLLTNPNRCFELGAAARRRAAEIHDRRSVAWQLAQAIGSDLGATPR